MHPADDLALIHGVQFSRDLEPAISQVISYVVTPRRFDVRVQRRQNVHTLRCLSLGIRQSLNLEPLGLKVIYNRRINDVGHVHVQFQASQIQSVPHLR